LCVVTTIECRCGIVLAHVCLSVCLIICPVCALTFGSLDLETSFLVCEYIFRISRSNLYIKIIRVLSYGYKNRVYKRN